MAIIKRTNSNYNIITPTGTNVTIQTDNVFVTNNTVSNGTLIANSTSTSTSTTTGALIVAGGAGIAGNLNIGENVIIDGNLQVLGTQTIFNTNNTNITDSLIYLADNNTGDALDIGFISSFTNPGYQHTGFVRDASDGVWKLFANVTIEPLTTVDFTDAIYSPLQVGNLISSATTSATSTTTGAITTAGGAGIAGALYVGDVINVAGNLHANSTAISINTITGALTVAGGAGIAGNLNIGLNFNTSGNGTIGQNLVTTGNITTNSTSPSTTTSTGALIVAGGAGIAGNIYAGGRLSINSLDGTAAIVNGGTSGVGNIGASGQVFNTIFATNLNGTLVTTSQPNVTSVGTLSSLAVSGAITVNSGDNAAAIVNGGTSGVGNIGASGQVFNTIFATNLNGTLQTAAQPNVTSVGTLDGVNIAGTVALSSGAKTTYDQAYVIITNTATPYIIDSFPSANYSSAKYVIQAKQGSTYIESFEALLVNDGANAFVTTYAIVNNGTPMGTISANIASGNVNLYYTSPTITGAFVKTHSTYIV